jgi:hypothetical protein
MCTLLDSEAPSPVWVSVPVPVTRSTGKATPIYTFESDVHSVVTFQTLQKSNPKKTSVCGKKLSGAKKLSFGQNSEWLYITYLYYVGM